MDLLVKEIKFRLSSIGIEEFAGPNVRPLTDSQKALLLHVVLYGAFYPNYFTRDFSGQIDERESVKTLSGLDPFKTVYLKHFIFLKTWLENYLMKITCFPSTLSKKPSLICFFPLPICFTLHLK